MVTRGCSALTKSAVIFSFFRSSANIFALFRLCDFSLNNNDFRGTLPGSISNLEGLGKIYCRCLSSFAWIIIH